MPNHRVEAIANAFLDRAKHEGRSLTNMQLQKLPYIAQGWALTLTDQSLLKDAPKAFPYGPVYQCLYNALRRYGSGPVTDLIREHDGTAADEFGGARGEPIAGDLSDGESKLIDAVWNAYKKYSAYQLSEMTHGADSPWSIVTKRDGKLSDIPNDVIKIHYDNLKDSRQSKATT